ncbi:tRNA (N(6)-L-threonylcarbamoyladenosine(37)-C(2))-methylthiotransferase [Candidatus Pacearchaeota archaeon]|nr:tRNA (N(6)-L-threonylcarbamoyladenosine(37)-C(2))-methylthiotransferase [Candidatus Pacearchaeota archaeon]
MSKKMSGNRKRKIRSIYVENYGCAANAHDLEIMLGYLLINGYVIEKNLENADAIIVNTCGVKKPTEDKILYRLGVLRNSKIPIIVTGCLPRINFSAIESVLPEYSAVLDPYSVDCILKAIDSTKKGYYGVKFISNEPLTKVGLPEGRLNDLVKIVPIAEGCLGECAYCCTRLARGKLSSFPLEGIVEEVRVAVSKGAIEVWITGQDTGAYGKDIGTGLSNLLRNIIKITGDFKIRIGMMNPQYAMEMLEDLISIYQDDKIYDFLHIPIQSGSDDVLKSMNRHYAVADVMVIIEKFRHLIPDITISTDMIVGFPTENDDNFNHSIKFVREIEPDIVNISKYAPRPGTPTVKLGQDSVRKIQERSRELSSICSEISLRKNTRYIDSEQIISITQKIRKNVYVGRLQNYKKVYVNDEEALLGKRVHIKIIDATQRYLDAEVISRV